MPNYNLPKKINDMINHVQLMTEYYPAKQNIAVCIGDDFYHGLAFDTFNVLDKYMAKINADE